jgi:hypothetical protein
LNSLKRVAIVISLVFSTFLFPTSNINAAPNPLTLPEESLLADPISMRNGFSGLATAFAEKTRYLLALDVNFQTGRVTGQARILFVNHTSATLDKAVFRLYGNHPRFTVRNNVFKARMAINNLTANNQPVRWQVRDRYQTVLDVPFSAPLPPGGRAEINVDYEIAANPPADSLELRQPYPLLAVFENGAWREDLAIKSLDQVFSEAALYTVTIRASRNLQMWSTGVVKSAAADADSTIHTIVTGPVREFMVVLARGWGEIKVEGGPFPITVHYSGNQANAQHIADTVLAVTKYYDQNFGAYPYAEFDILAMNFPSGGEEYPALIFVNIIDNGKQEYLRFVTAHEVAHQWFYGVAGNDTLNHAWLDESLAQISGYLFYKNIYGPDLAQREYWQHILTWYNRIKGTPRPIDTPLDDYNDFNDYMSTIYGGGSVFLRDLAEQMGDTAFITGLQTYYRGAFLGVGTPRQFFDSMQLQIQIDLAPLFCGRVGIICQR